MAATNNYCKCSRILHILQASTASAYTLFLTALGNILELGSMCSDHCGDIMNRGACENILHWHLRSPCCHRIRGNIFSLFAASLCAKRNVIASPGVAPWRVLVVPPELQPAVGLGLLQICEGLRQSCQGSSNAAHAICAKAHTASEREREMQPELVKAIPDLFPDARSWAAREDESAS